MNIKRTIKRIVYSNSIFEFLFSSFLRLRWRWGGGVKVINNGAIGRVTKNCVGKDNVVILGNNAIVYNPIVYIRGCCNMLLIGDNCHIGSGCSFRLEGNNVKIIIGEHTTVTRNVQFCAQEDNSTITVGEDCMFSNTIIVRTSDSHPIFDENNNRINLPADVYIGNHVWIAPNSKIFKGVNIGDNSIIGSDTLVIHSIPAEVLAVGHPAIVIKEKIKWTRDDLF